MSELGIAPEASPCTGAVHDILTSSFANHRPWVVPQHPKEKMHNGAFRAA